MPRITQKKHWSPHKRTRIRMMYEQGYSKSQIASKEHIPKGSVHGIATQYTQQISAQSKPRPGQPKKLTKYDKRHIKRMIRENPFITNQELLNTIDLRISIKTLSAYLKSEGIQHMSALRRPKLTATAAAERLRFALEHANKPLSYWYKVFFSDEVSIAKSEPGRKGWVFCCRVSTWYQNGDCNISTTNSPKGRATRP